MMIGDLKNPYLVFDMQLKVIIRMLSDSDAQSISKDACFEL